MHRAFDGSWTTEKLSYWCFQSRTLYFVHVFADWWILWQRLICFGHQFWIACFCSSLENISKPVIKTYIFSFVILKFFLYSISCVAVFTSLELDISGLLCYCYMIHNLRFNVLCFYATRNENVFVIKYHKL